MQIALGYFNKQDVSLLADHLGTAEDGSIRFSVVNGAWVGTFKDNKIFIHETKASVPASIVWAGDAIKGHYNDVLPQLRELIHEPDYVMMPMEEILAYDPNKVKKIPSIDYDEYDDVPF